VKLDVSHLRAFGAPCAIVEPKERLRKFDDRAIMYFCVGYKYQGGGYRIWDPKRQVVVESRDIVFFEDGLPSPTLNDPPPRPVDEDESVAQPVLDRSIKPTTPPMRPRCPHRPRQRPRPCQRLRTSLYRRQHLFRASSYAYPCAG